MLHQLADDGHVYYPYEPLLAQCQEILGVDREFIALAIALFMRDSEWERVSKGRDMYKAMLSAWTTSKTEYRGIEKQIDRVSKEKKKKEFEEKKRPGFMPIIHGDDLDGSKSQMGDDEDLSWLYD